jgi:carboxypeptidase Q
MRRIILLPLLLFATTVFSQNDSLMLRKIYTETLMNGTAYNSLYELTKNIGHRISGSPQAAKAVEWAKQKMIEAGADTVYLQDVMVPHWIRGKKESAAIVEANGNKTPVPVLALGNSICTPPGGITAQVIEINDFEQLKSLGKEKIKGKIVFYNHPFNESFIETFRAYGEAVEYRWAGPSEASRYGAIATVCRSMTNAQDDFPHTGAMHYNDSMPSIPCCAISTNAANLLSRIIKANKETKFTFTQECQFGDSVKSYNVIGEVRGSVYPDRYITVGGHLDSWDVGEGAHDDGTGVVQSIELLRIFKSPGMRPKATIRIVAFMNEENGLRGGKKYAQIVKEKNEKLIAAMESDGGGSSPIGFGLEMKDEERAKIKSWAPLFLPYGIYNFRDEGDGSDIGPLEALNVPRIGLFVSPQRYFDYHHTDNDTFDKVNKRELLLGAAAMASMAYMLSEHFTTTVGY